ncbi:hypothetical protein HPB50_018810 [Hyalomma asiaticum]|uniref:Uncharacterized protein n=1 Tax=Hyalomma asiaticum TaxID=266040 RepID=A0ACB7TK19_HYAAI|nr:hypothetical protein HPB50_018810 [Hyalomma asiaticum]
MAADSADFQRLYTLARVATNWQQFKAAITTTAAENSVATTSQGNVICFDEGGAGHEAHPPAHSVFEGITAGRHYSKLAQLIQPLHHTLLGRAESAQVFLRDAMRMIVFDRCRAEYSAHIELSR